MKFRRIQLTSLFWGGALKICLKRKKMNLFYLSAVHNSSLLSYIVSNRWSPKWCFLQRTRLSWALSRRLSFASLWRLTAQSSVLLILCSLRERRRSQREKLSAVSAQTIHRFWSRTKLPDSKRPDTRCKYWRFEREKVRKRTFFCFIIERAQQRVWTCLLSVHPRDKRMREGEMVF